MIYSLLKLGVKRDSKEVVDSTDRINKLKREIEKFRSENKKPPHVIEFEGRSSIELYNSIFSIEFENRLKKRNIFEKMLGFRNIYVNIHKFLGLRRIETCICPFYECNRGKDEIRLIRYGELQQDGKKGDIIFKRFKV